MRRELIARFTLSAAFACGLAASTAQAQDICDHADVTLIAPIDEEHDACAAFKDVLRYFAAGGLTVALQLTIRFQPSVVMEISQGADKEAAAIPVMGRFHRSRNEVQIISSASPSRLQRTPWTLPWSAEIGRSILQHEIVHAVIARLLGEKYDKLPRAWHEALAYAVQIDLMSPGLRAKVLAAYPDAAPFDATTKINDITYGFDPDGFAVRAFLTYARDGRLTFLKKAIAFEFDMIDFREIYN